MANTTPLGDGPYRDRPTPTPPKNGRDKRIYIVIAAILGSCVLWLFMREAPKERPAPSLATLTLPDARPLGAFPTALATLPEAIPLGPLLVADSPAGLSILAPQVGVQRLSRHSALRIQFSRPMVSRAQVGDLVEHSPLQLRVRSTSGRLTGLIGGTTRWVTRSTLTFDADDRAWDRNREAVLGFDETLRSLDGAALLDDRERVVVFDGTPHAQSRGVHRVAPGQPLALYFDNPVSAADLRGDVMAYEVGGGARSLPFSLRSRGADGRRFRVDVMPSRQLEAGSNIAVALAPRWWTWAGPTPGVMRFMVQPPPQIEAVGCSEQATSASQCRHGAAPGQVVDIAGTLRILASESLVALVPSQLSVTPPLPNLEVNTSSNGRVASLTGRWAPDQVYEVRFGEMTTTAGATVQRFAALAVRSRGQTPHVALVGQGAGIASRQTFEREAMGVLHLRGIHVRKGAIIRRALDPAQPMQRLQAALNPALFVSQAHDVSAYTPLAALIPDARPNHHALGVYNWRGEEGAASAVVALRPGASGSRQQVVFLQTTNVAPSVLVLPTGVQVWVTRLSDASPVAGAEVHLSAVPQNWQNWSASDLLTGTTDADGVVFLPTETSLASTRFAVSAATSDDQAVLVVEHSVAMGPARLGIQNNSSQRDMSLPIAAVLTDRGAYRPGTEVHASAVIRLGDGPDVHAVADKPFVLRLVNNLQASPIGEAPVTSDRFGFIDHVFELPTSAPLGEYHVVVFQPESDLLPERQLGSESLRVANFRQPTFRVDLEGPPLVVSGESPTFSVTADYLFGAPVSDAKVAWSLLRRGPVQRDSRYRGFSFSPVDSHTASGTEHAGELHAGEDGQAQIATESVEGSARQRMTLEVEVTDASGQATAAHHDFVVAPASVEVGIEGGPAWIDLGEPLALRGVVLDDEGRSVSGQSVSVRFVREGWHRWHEWHENGYVARRNHVARVLHTCSFQSDSTTAIGIGISGCEFLPERPGTYVMEAEVRDDQGRIARASRRLYVAGPNEAPDRDPPGAPIALTPRRTKMNVGETAAIAFESPWDAAEALLTVYGDTQMRVERLSVGPGGHTFEFELTEDMAPNVFVSLSLVRPRTGEPTEGADVGSPDLRFGATEIEVRPQDSSLQVHLDAPAEGEPGEEIEVAGIVVREDGSPASASVTLWAVDEGLLRLTDYTPRDLSEGLFPNRPGVFSLEDLRRGLVSRIAPEGWRAGGDGSGEDEGGRVLRPEAQFPEPVPLWRPGLETNADGHFSARFVLPDRASEYRIMAVVMDEGRAFGTDSHTIRSQADFVVQNQLPRFATAGDRFEAGFVVHATGRDIHAPLIVTVGEDEHRFEVNLTEGDSERFVLDVDVPERRTLSVLTEFEGQRSEHEIPIAARGRWTRSLAFGAVQGSVGQPLNQALALRFPTIAQGHARLEVASHPFLGLEVLPARIANSPWQTLRERAARLILIAAAQRLGENLVGRDRSQSVGSLDPFHERRAEAGQAIASLIRLQLDSGAFGFWSRRDWSDPWTSAIGVHALVAARGAGFDVPAPAYDRALAWLQQTVENSPYTGGIFADPQTGRAYGLRVLAEAGQPLPEIAEEMFTRRDELSIEARAFLSLAMGDADKGEQRTLALEAADYAANDYRTDDSLPTVVRFVDKRGLMLGPVLEAVCAADAAHGEAGQVASTLLALTRLNAPYAWRSPLDAAFAAYGLAAYANLFRVSGAGEVALDGNTLEASSRGAFAARYELPLSNLGHRNPLAPENLDLHSLAFSPPGEGPVFYSIEGEWAEPLNETDWVARGTVALHRRFETASGRVLSSGDSVPLGTMLRVRLFVYSEQPAGSPSLLRDPLGGGFEAVQSHFATTATAAVNSMLGADPSDSVADPRAFHALRSASAITHRALERNMAVFGFQDLPAGLLEFTYAVRATTPGHYTIPPAQIDAAQEADFIGRSAAFELNVVREDSAQNSSGNTAENSVQGS